MVNGGLVKANELIALKLVKARARGDYMRFMRYKRMWLMLQMYMRTSQLHSPRFYYKTSDFPATSFWAHLRETRRPGAWMRFLGFPPQVVDVLADAMRPYLSKYDAELRVGKKGRPTRLDYYDVCAVVLRRLQIAGSLLKYLEEDFGIVDSVLAGEDGVIEIGRRAMYEAVTKLEAARICYPNEEEGLRMWEGVTSPSRIGPPPFQSKPLILMMDGTTTPVHNISNEDGTTSSRCLLNAAEGRGRGWETST